MKNVLLIMIKHPAKKETKNAVIIMMIIAEISLQKVNCVIILEMDVLKLIIIVK